MEHKICIPHQAPIILFAVLIIISWFYVCFVVRHKESWEVTWYDALACVLSIIGACIGAIAIVACFLYILDHFFTFC